MLKGDDSNRLIKSPEDWQDEFDPAGGDVRDMSIALKSHPQVVKKCAELYQWLQERSLRSIQKIVSPLGDFKRPALNCLKSHKDASPQRRRMGCHCFGGYTVLGLGSQKVLNDWQKHRMGINRCLAIQSLRDKLLITR